MIDEAIADSSLHVTGFWRRFGAGFVDFIILAALFSFLSPHGTSNMEIHTCAEGICHDNTNSVVTLIFSWLYFACFHCSPLQATPGMMLLNFKVTDVEGRKISFRRATGRFFMSIVSSLILGFGYLMIAWDEKGRALHDKVAGTLCLTNADKSR